MIVPELDEVVKTEESMGSFRPLTDMLSKFKL